MIKITSTRIGIITGILMVIISIIAFYGMKMPANGTYKFIVAAVFALGTFISVYLFGKAAPNAGFKDLFSAGFKTFVVATLIIVVYTFVFYKLNPNIIEDAIKVNNEMVKKAGDHTPQEIEDNANSLRKIFMPMTLSVTLLLYLILGAVTSALVSMGFMMQKK